ncbi:MAG: glycosyltransferase family 87 protein [Bryobacteraceae bacterium]
MSRRNLFLAGCILIGLLIDVLAGQHLWSRAKRGENDFLQLFAGARLVRTPELYVMDASLRVHREVTESGTYYPAVCYTRLPWYALMLSPLGKLPYRTAYYIWEAFNATVFVVFLWLWSREYPPVWALAALSIPLLVNLLNGQDSGLVTALCGFALLLERRGRDLAAGVLLSLASIKFHLLVLVPIGLVIHRRWGILKGGLAGGAALFVLSAIADGFDWPGRYLAVLRSPAVHPGAETMTTFRNLAWFVSGAENPSLELVLSVATAALFAYLAWRIRSFGVMFGLALAGGVLVCHHAYSQDLVVLVLMAALFATAGASTALTNWTIALAMPPAAFLLYFGFPLSAALPVLLLSILLVALADAHRQTGARSGNQAAR